MRLKAIFFAALALTMGSCGESAKIKTAKEAVTNLLKDPESAQWKNIRDGQGGSVCGEVNAKNSLGGYTGFKKFLVMDGKAKIEPELTGDKYTDGLLSAMFPYDIWCK